MLRLLSGIQSAIYMARHDIAAFISPQKMAARGMIAAYATIRMACERYCCHGVALIQDDDRRAYSGFDLILTCFDERRRVPSLRLSGIALQDGHRAGRPIE